MPKKSFQHIRSQGRTQDFNPLHLPTPHVFALDGPILMKICMNANITKTQLFHSDLITTLTYVLMDNFLFFFGNFGNSKRSYCIIKNVSSARYHKKLPSSVLIRFFFLFSSTFTNKLILIKIKSANIIKTQPFFL